MGELIDLDGRRLAPPTVEASLSCPCGSHWFDLVGHDGGRGSVTARPDGTITEYDGHLRCRQCHQEAITDDPQQ